MPPRRSEGEELEYPFFEGDGSSFDVWVNYGVVGDDYEGPLVFDDDQYEEKIMIVEEESMPVHDTVIEDVIEEEEGFIRKGGFGGEEDNIKDVIVVANDLCSSMIHTTLSVDFSKIIDLNPHELTWIQKGNFVESTILTKPIAVYPSWEDTAYRACTPPKTTSTREDGVISFCFLPFTASLSRQRKLRCFHRSVNKFVEEYRKGAERLRWESSPCNYSYLAGNASLQANAPYVRDALVTQVDAENWISHMEKIFDVMGCDDVFKASVLAVITFEGDALAWWKAYSRPNRRDDEWISLGLGKISREYSSSIFPSIADAARNFEINYETGDDYDRLITSERGHKSGDRISCLFSRIVTGSNRPEEMTVMGQTGRAVVETLESGPDHRKGVAVPRSLPFLQNMASPRGYTYPVCKSHVDVLTLQGVCRRCCRYCFEVAGQAGSSSARLNEDKGGYVGFDNKSGLNGYQRNHATELNVFPSCYIRAHIHTLKFIYHGFSYRGKSLKIISALVAVLYYYGVKVFQGADANLKAPYRNGSIESERVERASCKSVGARFIRQVYRHGVHQLVLFRQGNKDECIQQASSKKDDGENLGNHLMDLDKQTEIHVDSDGNSMAGALKLCVPEDLHFERFYPGHLEDSTKLIWICRGSVCPKKKDAIFFPIRKDLFPSVRLGRCSSIESFDYNGTTSAIVSDRDPRFTSRFWKWFFTETLGVLPGSSSVRPFSYRDRTDSLNVRFRDTGGHVRSCAFEWTGNCGEYICFVEFGDHMRGRIVPGKELKSIIDRQVRVMRKRLFLSLNPLEESSWRGKPLGKRGVFTDFLSYFLPHDLVEKQKEPSLETTMGLGHIVYDVGVVVVGLIDNQGSKRVP
ncbi:hypothetical protein Tco_1355382 [Tanacetum coccineum]